MSSLNNSKSEEQMPETIPGHANVSFDMTCPRQYTARGGWNISCECGASLGDTGYSEEEQETLWKMHLRLVKSRLETGSLTKPCDLPGRGFVCHLGRGHTGPCPAYAKWWKKLELYVRTGVWWP